MSYKHIRLTAQGTKSLAPAVKRGLHLAQVELALCEPSVSVSVEGRPLTEGQDYTTTWTIDADDVMVCGCGHVYLPDWQCTMAETRDEPADYEARCPECRASTDAAEPLSDYTGPITEQDCESAALWGFVDWYRQQD